MTVDQDALLDRVAKELAARTIVPNATYAPDEAAALLHLGHRKRVHEIPEAELPRRRVGAKRGRVVFMGSDLLEYLGAGT